MLVAPEQAASLFYCLVAGASTYGGFEISAGVKERLQQKFLQPPIVLIEHPPLFYCLAADASTYADFALSVEVWKTTSRRELQSAIVLNKRPPLFY
ncbi:hypothetical protein [Pseudobacillus wudalianchiensis]|uniref:Uncharacterized protein n=1 Tax=Pseudobacillus wudalianchiensis TaxID=1743143 RepID=A0A1B9B677_9BACI|nr:hypothetical protein [Bacillus wudalianchiensis]OCA91605.1 hypothetical protein A8F95_20905 [Bacillus wudalianchiensis]